MLVLNRIAWHKMPRRLAAACERMASQQAKIEPDKTVNNLKDDKRGSNSTNSRIPANVRQIYPEFLPAPRLEWRNTIREKIERTDMLNRRANCEIPEFYVGSIMAVTTADPHAPGKTSRFLGLCIDRLGCGLRTQFILRNVIDHEGMEVRYNMYDPALLHIEVIRLEKRLDDKLYYLRDALPEYSTFDINMEPELHPDGKPIPINPIQVQLKPRPWLVRWERANMKGISNALELITPKMVKQIHRGQKPWLKYDLMHEYRQTIPAEDQNDIFSEIHPQLDAQELLRKRKARQRVLKSSMRK